MDYRKPPLRGSLGTIKKCYSNPNYTAFEVLFPTGTPSCSGTTSWRRQGSDPSGKSGGGFLVASCRSGHKGFSLSVLDINLGYISPPKAGEAGGSAVSASQER